MGEAVGHGTFDPEFCQLFFHVVGIHRCHHLQHKSGQPQLFFHSQSRMSLFLLEENKRIDSFLNKKRFKETLKHMKMRFVYRKRKNVYKDESISEQTRKKDHDNSKQRKKQSRATTE